MLRALRWNTRSLSRHTRSRTQSLESIIRRTEQTLPAPLPIATVKRMRAEASLESKKTSPENNDPPTSLSSETLAPKKSSKWIPTLAQLQVLESIFQESPYNTSSAYHELAIRLRAPPKSIPLWFMNRRRKAKKGVSSTFTRVAKRSSAVEDFWERPKDSLLSFTCTTRAKRISDRPPIRTLDLSQVTASDFVDLSGIRGPHLAVMVGSESITGVPTYDTVNGSSVAFPPGTTGFFYFHAPAGRPAYEGSIRFKHVPNTSFLGDLHEHGDLMKLNGLPWSIPLWVGDQDQRPFVAKAVEDGFVTQDMFKRVTSIINGSPRAGRKSSVVVYGMSQVFAVPLDRKRMTVWVVTDDMKTRLDVKTDFLGEFKRQKDGSETGCALVSMTTHPVYEDLAFVVESVQRSKGSPQMKVHKPTFTLLEAVLIKKTQYDYP